MKKIRCAKGKTVLVDCDDFESLTRNKWNVSWNGRDFYAYRQIRSGNGRRSIQMSRQIMNAPHGMIVDHINHNTLDNQKHNLRIVTRSQNMQNRKGPTTRSQTGLRGVFLDRRRGTFQAMIEVNGVSVYLGAFKTARLASVAYASANMKYFGKFGGMNP